MKTAVSKTDYRMKLGHYTTTSARGNSQKPDLKLGTQRKVNNGKKSTKGGAKERRGEQTPGVGGVEMGKGRVGKIHRGYSSPAEVDFRECDHEDGEIKHNEGNHGGA